MLPAKNLVFYLRDPIKELVVKDFMHLLLPEYTKMNIVDIPQTILWLVTFVLLVVIPILVKKCHQKNVYGAINFMQAMFLSCIMYSIRAFSMTITILPDPSPACRNELIKPPKNMFGKNFNKILLLLSTFYEPGKN